MRAPFDTFTVKKVHLVAESRPSLLYPIRNDLLYFPFFQANWKEDRL